MGNSVTPAKRSTEYRPTDVQSPDELFIEDDASIPILPPPEMSSSSIPQETGEQLCDSFDPDSVAREMARSIARLPAFQWGDCVSATLRAEELLHPYLSAYKPEYHIRFGQGVDVGSMTAGHVWLETYVCGENFLTDFVGGTSEGLALGFGAHYFTNTISTSVSTGYRFHPLGEFISIKPVELSSEAFKQSYKKAYEQLPLPLYTRLGIYIGKWLED